MTTAEADAEAKRRFGPTGYARPSLGMFCVAQVKPFTAVAYGLTYEDAFAWADGKRPDWWYERPAGWTGEWKPMRPTGRAFE